jgi:hypothetical protein
MRFTSKSLACAVGGVVVASWLIVQQTSSVAHAERSLTLREAWSLHGGSTETCREAMGRCYISPLPCSEYNEQNCETGVAHDNLGANTASCRPSTNPEDNCVEAGETPCSFSINCTPLMPNGIFLVCTENENGEWLPSLNVGPQFVQWYTDCE